MGSGMHARGGRAGDVGAGVGSRLTIAKQQEGAVRYCTSRLLLRHGMVHFAAVLYYMTCCGTVLHGMLQYCTTWHVAVTWYGTLGSVLYQKTDA